VIIVGAGFGGLAAAIELNRHGFTDVTILEAAPDLGGTWYYNDYPGAACDVPSHAYSLSYAQLTQWSRLCSPRDEILNYLHTVADRFDVRKYVRTSTFVTECRWDEASCTWTVRSRGADGAEATHEAEALVLATGQLNQPAMPRIEGIETFGGTSFHSARWDHDYDLRGKRVAVIGTGASAVQFVPEIAKVAKNLTVFQRSGNWFLSRRNRPYPSLVKKLFKSFPKLQPARRQLTMKYLECLTAAIRNPKTAGRLGAIRSSVFMRMQLRDPEVRRKVWPDYTFGCKRVLFSSAFLPALQRPNVELVTERVTRMEPAGPVTEDGRVHEVDCVIYGTGFKTNDFMLPMRVVGVGGRTLEQQWSQGARAHLGITVTGFPSLFMLYGPNTNTSGGSIVFFLEQQVGYLRQALQQMLNRGASAINVRPEAERLSDARTQARFDGTAWTRCDSWYRNESGRVIANWSGYMSEYADLTATPDLSEFELLHRTGSADERVAAKTPEPSA
jgi:cation diffusion facilitator CzcD-associated flavoprotein CzcO